MLRPAFCLALLAAPAWAGHTLTPKQKGVLDAWLSKHIEYRRATDADCECVEMLQAMRSGATALPGYHPYVATGDFNRDGEVDFAVVLIKRARNDGSFALVIFNGPYGSETTGPTYFKSGLSLKGQGLGFGPPGSPPDHLLLGPFFSDFIVTLEPSAKTYIMKASGS